MKLIRHVELRRDDDFRLAVDEARLVVLGHREQLARFLAARPARTGCRQPGKAERQDGQTSSHHGTSLQIRRLPARRYIRAASITLDSQPLTSRIRGTAKRGPRLLDLRNLPATAVEDEDTEAERHHARDENHLGVAHAEEPCQKKKEAQRKKADRRHEQVPFEASHPAEGLPRQELRSDHSQDEDQADAHHLEEEDQPGVPAPSTRGRPSIRRAPTAKQTAKTRLKTIPAWSLCAAERLSKAGRTPPTGLRARIPKAFPALPTASRACCAALSLISAAGDRSGAAAAVNPQAAQLAAPSGMG